LLEWVTDAGENADDLPTVGRLRHEEGRGYNEEVAAPLFFQSGAILRPSSVEFKEDVDSPERFRKDIRRKVACSSAVCLVYLHAIRMLIDSDR
jgi:hypothetical protein